MRWAFPFIIGLGLGYAIATPSGQRMTRTVVAGTEKAIAGVFQQHEAPVIIKEESDAPSPSPVG